MDWRFVLEVEPTGLDDGSVRREGGRGWDDSLGVCVEQSVSRNGETRLRRWEAGAQFGIGEPRAPFGIY